ncbi:hypothetical protein KY338_01850 [Candidatus Woesearchaeota archaeon]|nr:hypothetical protein [Candidatus Woesearchaeota archaeon]
MAELRKLGVLSFAKMNALLSAFMGFVLGIFYAVLGTFAQASGTALFPGIPMFILGFGLVIILPIFYGILGFIMGAILAALYNLFASWFGGIEMKFKVHQ